MTHKCICKLVLCNIKNPPFSRNRLYPHCETSKEVIKLLWDPVRKRVRKVFTDDEVRQMKKIGFEIEIIGDKYE